MKNRIRRCKCSQEALGVLDTVGLNNATQLFFKMQMLFSHLHRIVNVT